MRYTLAQRLACFRAAWQGLRWMIRHEANVRIHAVATVVVTGMGFALRVSAQDWLWLVTAMALMWITEALNTAVEQLADEISDDRRERLGRAKDLGAGAVLVAALTAVVIAIVVFLPHARRLLD